jgi:hypothetical protein
VEYETLVEDLAGRPQVRATKPAVKATGSPLSAAEHAAAGLATGASPALGPAVVAGLQRTAGNAAVTALIQRSAGLTEAEDEVGAVRDIVGKGGGQPLNPALREEMEARFNDDLSAVRIHNDAGAARSAAAVSARAYTVGDEVVFGADAPALDAAEGKRTLAHELTHVIQQRQGPVSGTPVGGGITVSEPSDVFEQAAETNAARVLAPVSGSDTIATPEAVAAEGMSMQRQPYAADVEEEEEEEEEEAGAQAEEIPAETETLPAETAAEYEEESTELEGEEDQLAQAEAETEQIEEEEEEEVTA